MPTRPLTRAVQELRAAVAEPDAPVPTDAELLGRFVDQGDEAAFAMLVRRHGALVWGVCRRALGHHDSEDAYQATFLVLARKAATVRPRDALPNWLHGVARRTALAARADVAKRHSRERQPAVLPEPPAPAPTPPDDALDQELARLPEMYRVAVLLCDLEGRTGKEAARLLSLPEGTLSTRLRTGRRMLADRLARRGLAVPGGTLAATGRPTTFAASDPAVALADRVVRGLVLAQARLMATVVIVAVALLGGVGLVAGAFLGGRPATEAAAPRPPEPPAPPAAQPEDDEADLEALVARYDGTVYRDANAPGRPIFDVRFGGAKVDDAAVGRLAPHLARIGTLRALSLDGAPVGDAALKHLAAVRHLESLHLARTRVSDAGLKHLAGVGHLRVLNLAGTAVVGDGLADLVGLAALRALNLSDTPLRDGATAHLGRMRQLESLSLGGTPLPTASLGRLAGLGLRELHLPESAWNDDGLGHYLAAVEPRTRLNLRFWKLTDNGLRHLHGQQSLAILLVADTPVTDAGLRHLAGLARLDTLHLTRTRVRGTELGQLAKLPRLETLWLPGTPLDDMALAALVDLKQLRSLNLNGTGITDAGIDRLARLTDLRQLLIGGTKLTPEGVGRLQKALPGCAFH